MTALAAAGRRLLPRGYVDFVGQAAIWFGFYFSYLGVRSLADRNPSTAFLNGFKVIGWEQSWFHHLFEQTAQRVADSSQLLLTAAAWTYWNSEFTVIGLTLLWIYLRRYPHFQRFRNAILLANALGLIGYVLMPTAPPWMFPAQGFVDGVNHQSGLIQSLANPYAAMPSLHAGDALIVGVFMVATCRHWWSRLLWALWPAWVWFCVMATANHFLLDVVAGIGVALLSLTVVGWTPRAWRLIANLL
ncbi:MAG: phosphatase PAP2 family protein [Actinobacteria bacterium]|nr:phosphatase PAP2 family protein [Actinomycetota bacterium]MBV8563719.1 phosphatase PAP2 family protein [Actinomycetota bacterium]